jgi:hypothetical protein
MALACSWSGYADTGVGLDSFFGQDHTLAVRFLAQYPNAYRGPIVGATAGTYLIGQGDFLSDGVKATTKLIAMIGGQTIIHQVSIQAGEWHHLALVRSGDSYQLFFDGIAVEAAVSADGQVPGGTLRFGRAYFDPATDHGSTQFYGFVDDAAVFTRALSGADVAALAAEPALSGNENGLLAGFTFPAAYSGSGSLNPPIDLSYGATLVDVSPDRDGGADMALIPLASTDFVRVPFPDGKELNVIQGYDNAGGSHKGYASFCWDFILAGKPQSDSAGVAFDSAVFGAVDAVLQAGTSGTSDPPNYVSVQYGDNEFADHLHLAQNSAVVKVGDSVNAGDHLADIGDVGVPKGAFHLHLATTNLGEGHKGTGFVTVPAPLCNYEVSNDSGRTWQPVIRGIPTQGQWIRRPIPVTPLRYTAVWRPSTDGEIQVYGWTYEDYRAKYDELWPQGWRLKLLEVYMDGGIPRYTAVWQPSIEGEIQVYGWTYEDYRATYDGLWDRGWRLSQLVSYLS